MKRILLAALAASIPLTSLGQDSVTLLSVETTRVEAYLRPPRSFGVVERQWQVQRTSDLMDLRRGYVRFEIPESETIQSATLKVPIFRGFKDTEAPAIVVFHEAFAFDFDTIRHFGVGREIGEMAWDDWGRGDLYGSLDATWSGDLYNVLGEGDEMHTVRLTPLAVQSINSARGSDWAIGARFADDRLGVGMTRLSAHFPAEDGWSTPCDGASCHFQLELEYGPPPPLGDFNLSGTVEQGDLDFALLNWGTITAQQELDAVLLGWGQTTAPPLAPAAVPEPSTLALALAGSCLLTLVSPLRIAVGLAPLRLLAAKAVQVRRA